MATVLITYGSTTGNTAYMAEVLNLVFSGAGHSVTVKDAGDVKADGLCTDFDFCVFGSSTWGDEDIELQDDFASLLPELGKTGVKGKKTAVFGSGDISYTHFCGAVDAITEKLKELGAAPVIDGLKVDGDPRDEKEEIELWGKELLKALG